MALEKPRQQPAHCLFPTCSWALERHGKNYIWIVTHPFHSFVGGFWRLTPADLTWCGMMRKDVVCWACWFLVLVCWCFCFVLEVARCMGLLKRTQLSVFIFVAEVSAKCGPRSGTRNTLSMCATANLGIRVGHSTIGARVEQVKGFLRKDLGMIWPFWDDSGRLGVCRVFQISWLATTLQDSSSVTLQGHRRPSAHCAVWHRGQWIKSHTLSRTMKDLQSESSSKWSHLCRAFIF